MTIKELDYNTKLAITLEVRVLEEELKDVLYYGYISNNTKKYKPMINAFRTEINKLNLIVQEDSSC